MKLLEERIRKDGLVKEGNVLKVDSFLNHQMDIKLFQEMGKEWKKLFADAPINKILTIEASGIGIAAVAAQYFDVPVVFAKKSQSINLDGSVYSTKIQSFTHGREYDVIVSKKYLGPEDKVLIIDDFFGKRLRDQRTVRTDPRSRRHTVWCRDCCGKRLSGWRPETSQSRHPCGIPGDH